MDFLKRSGHLDAYTVRARAFPVLYVGFPAALTIFMLFPGFTPLAAGLWALASWCGVSMPIAQLGRGRGRRIEPKLFEAWGGKPTTIRLRHSEAANPVELKLLHQAIQKAIPTVQLPSQADEVSDPAAADEIYDAVVGVLRELTRDKTRFHLVFEENCNYGFRRNLWGLKPSGLAVSGIATAIFGAVLVAGFMAVLQPPVGVVAGFTICSVCFAMWAFGVTQNWVKGAADTYAAQLLRSAATLVESDGQRYD